MLPHLSDLIDDIMTLVRNDTGVAVGLGEAPDTPNFPKIIMYPLGTDEPVGSMADPNEIATMEIQFTVVGELARQALKAEDRLVTTLPMIKDLDLVVSWPTIRRGNLRRTEDRLYSVITTVSVKVSGT